MKIDQHFKSLFFHALRVRRIEEAIANHYLDQQMRCLIHLSIGQEAVAVGVCSQLDQKDPIMSTHRSHAHYLAKGGSLNKMIAELYGKQTGCCGGKGGSMHLIDLDAGFIGATPIAGGTVPVAVGLAFASLMKQDKKITVLFFGDESSEEGVFLESLNFAALKKLPILFVCESNLYSVCSPMHEHHPEQRSIPKIAEAHGIVSQKGAGNKIEQVVSMTQQALDGIRLGNGPQLIEFETYCFRERGGPQHDIKLGPRSQEELNRWQKHCPIIDAQNRLMEYQLLDSDELAQQEADISQEIQKAFDFGLNSPFPEPQELLTNLYAK